MALLDMAMETGGDYLKKEGYPPPSDSIYKNFSRPFLNKAVWHYLPDQQLPDDPEVALLIGLGGLALAFSPTLIEVYKRRNEEEKEEGEESKTEEKKEAPKEELITAKEGLEAPTVPPAWANRLQARVLPGL